MIGVDINIKFLIVMDSFKGSMSSMEAGVTVKEGILRALPNAEIIIKPLADGGEGTTEAFIEGLGGKKVILNVNGPMNDKVTTYYSLLEDTKTAIMEMAMASGIMLVLGKKNPMKASTYGVGEMILDAVQKGARNFIIGIGIASIAKKYGKKVVAFAGSVTSDARECNKKGIDAFFPIVRGVTTLEEAMEKKNAIQNLKETAEQVFRLF